MDISKEEARYKDLVGRADNVNNAKIRLEAKRDSFRSQLKEAMDEAKDAGLDPNNIEEEVQKAHQVLTIKLDNYQADIEAAETIAKPMLKELQDKT